MGVKYAFCVACFALCAGKGWLAHRSLTIRPLGSCHCSAAEHLQGFARGRPQAPAGRKSPCLPDLWEGERLPVRAEKAKPARICALRLCLSSLAPRACLSQLGLAQRLQHVFLCASPSDLRNAHGGMFVAFRSRQLMLSGRFLRACKEMLAWISLLPAHNPPACETDRGRWTQCRGPHMPCTDSSTKKSFSSLFSFPDKQQLLLSSSGDFLPPSSSSGRTRRSPQSTID